MGSEAATAAGPSGLIFDFKRFAVHDGPGIRTTVFLKGCSLACAWCHNPESIDAAPQLLVHPRRCIRCGACVAACPKGAHSMDAAGDHGFDRSLCTACGSCAEVCYAEALQIAGGAWTVEQALVTVMEDRSFYETSGGGVTLSGGEPFVQADFATALLRRCKQEGLHTAVDTSGHTSWNAIQGALPYVDLFLYDLKHMDPEQHRLHTGASNALILENLRRLAAAGVPIEIRVPVIPGVNDSEESAAAMGAFLAGLEGVVAVRLLPYLRLAGSKYASAGMKNTMPAVESPSRQRLLAVARAMSAACSRAELPFLVQDRPAGPLCLHEELEDLLDEKGREPERRLVQHDELRVHHQPPGDRPLWR